MSINRNTGKPIHDIGPIRDDWGRYYSHLEYRRIVWHDLWNPTQYIEVKDHSDKVNVCLSCGKLNDWFKWSCYQCEAEGERSESI